MLDSITFLDLETTGATPLRDRITEIALVRFEGGVEVARWQTLVNPEQPISAFIQSLTGISNEMVADAPKFAEVADTLLSYLEGTVLAAHNVRFDHGFLKSEFKRMGITLRQKVLCTVKLSRLLYPQFKSHGIDAIVERHNITGLARHRAMGDVDAILHLLEDAKRDLGEDALTATMHKLMSVPGLPAHINTQDVEDMPEAPGVYVFFGEQNTPLYVGKSANLRARVMSHFNEEKITSKERRLSQEIKHITWTPTAGELSAELLEAQLIKVHQPTYHRLQRQKGVYSWQLLADTTQQPCLRLLPADEINATQVSRLFGTFRSKRQATEVLRKIADAHQLCHQVLGLEAPNAEACIAFQRKRCKGVCCGKESAETHLLRVQQALSAHKIKTWPFAGKVGVVEHSLENDLQQIHVFEHWAYLGGANDESDLHLLSQQAHDATFDLDVYKLLIRMLNSKKTKWLPL